MEAGSGRFTTWFINAHVKVAKIMLSHLRRGHSLLGSFISAKHHVRDADDLFIWTSNPDKQLAFFRDLFIEQFPEDKLIGQISLALRPYIEILDYW